MIASKRRSEIRWVRLSTDLASAALILLPAKIYAAVLPYFFRRRDESLISFTSRSSRSERCLAFFLLILSIASGVSVVNPSFPR